MLTLFDFLPFYISAYTTLNKLLAVFFIIYIMHLNSNKLKLILHHLNNKQQQTDLVYDPFLLAT